MRCYALLLLIWSQFSLGAEPKWMAVLSTDSSVKKAVTSAGRFRMLSTKITVVASNDCTNLKPGLFLSVAGNPNNKEAAQRIISEIRTMVPDAYVRVCNPKPGSRVQFGISAVDESLFDVPSDAVNFESKDYVSEVRTAGSVHVWLHRQYLKDKEDAREGRRTAVLLFKTDLASTRKLTPDCVEAQTVVSDDLLALTCATENAGDNLLHQVKVFDTSSGRTVRTIDRCRNPVFVGGGELTCAAEAVGSNGELNLNRKRLPLR